MKTVLLTGATGFVGSRVLTQLLAAGFDVLTLGRHTPAERVRAHLSADLRDRAAVEKALAPHKDIRILIHLAAAIPTQSVPTDALEEMRRDNVETTRTLLELMPESVSQVIFASTLDVYGAPQWLPLTEIHPLEPVTAYAESKKEAEEYLSAACRERGFKICILRLTQIYGPGEAPVKAIPRFLGGILAGRAPVLFGDGSDLRDYLHVDDAARAFVLAAERKAEGICNIASGTSVSIKDTLDLLLQLCGSSLRPELRERQKPKMDFVFDIRAARRDLGFEPSVPFEAGLRTEIDAMRSALTSS